MPFHRIRKIILLFNLTIILYGCTAFKLGYEMNDYINMGWMEVNRQQAGERTGYKRLIDEMHDAEVVRNTIDIEGYPDYIRVNDDDTLNLAYIENGYIITLSTGSVERVIAIQNYTDFKHLKREIYNKFAHNSSSTQSTKYSSNSLDAPVNSTMANKPVLVLFPIQVDLSDDNYAVEFGAALQEGLSNRFDVFYGPIVEDELNKEYQKIDCSIESCQQNIAIAFNGELIGDATAKKVSGGYILKLVIFNVLTGRIIESQTYPCDFCDEFDVIREFKRMGGD